MKPFTEFFLEYRRSIHNFDDLSLQDAYQIAYKEFINQGFTTASTFAIWDYLYRLLPEKIKTPDVQNLKKKSSGTSLRPFVVKLINGNAKSINFKKLKSELINPENIRNYLNRQDYGNRRTGLLKDLSSESDYDVKGDY